MRTSTWSPSYFSYFSSILSQVDDHSPDVFHVCYKRHSKYWILSVVFDSLVFQLSDCVCLDDRMVMIWWRWYGNTGNCVGWEIFGSKREYRDWEPFWIPTRCSSCMYIHGVFISEPHHERELCEVCYHECVRKLLRVWMYIFFHQYWLGVTIIKWVRWS